MNNIEDPFIPDYKARRIARALNIIGLVPQKFKRKFYNLLLKDV